MPKIHPTAIVSEQATIADDVTIDAYAIIEGSSTLHPGCRVQAGAQLIGRVELGEGSVVGRAAIIGEDPQDLSFDSTIKSGVRIGEGCVLREHVTIHRSSKEGGWTEVGARNFLMVGVHLGHDVTTGEDNIVANSVLFAGHVHVGRGCFIGGGSVFHQHLRVGDLCMVQGNSSMSQDVPPYCTATGLNQLVGLNSIGLRRSGIAAEERRQLKELYQLLLSGKHNLTQGLAEAEKKTWGSSAQTFFNFAKETNRRGLCSPRKTR